LKPDRSTNWSSAMACWHPWTI